MTDILGRVLGKTIEGVVDVKEERSGRFEISMNLSDGSELRILNPEDVTLKEPTTCPLCGHSLEAV